MESKSSSSPESRERSDPSIDMRPSYADRFSSTQLARPLSESRFRERLCSLMTPVDICFQD